MERVWIEKRGRARIFVDFEIGLLLLEIVEEEISSTTELLISV